MWTATVWTSEAALQEFSKSTEHREAVAVGQPAIKTMQLRRFKVPARELPLGWSRILAFFNGPAGA